jgi:putative transcriptional regulator
MLCADEAKANSKLLFLVARPSILDPIFERSVVVMVPLEGEPLIVGLIVNKPTRLALRDLFPKSPALKKRSDIAFMGGPVDMSSPALVFHASKPPRQAMLLYDDVYLSFDGRYIASRLQDSKQTGGLRLFLGRAQWAPEQLQGEALRDSWYSLRAEGEVIFEGDSEKLWSTLHERARPSSNILYRIPRRPDRQFRVSTENFVPPLLQVIPASVHLDLTTLAR